MTDQQCAHTWRREDQVRAKLAEHGLTPESPDEELRKAFSACVAPNKCYQIAVGLRQGCAHTWRRVAFSPIKLEGWQELRICAECLQCRIIPRGMSEEDMSEHGQIVPRDQIDPLQDMVPYHIAGKGDQTDG